MLVEFCLPVYNEEKIIEASALKLLEFCQKKNFSFAWKIIFVVNGSSDRSADICRSLTEHRPNFFGFFEGKERGRGWAIKKYWLQSPADILVYMDTDLATSLENIPDLLAPLLSGEGDLSIGSRLLAKSRIERPVSREIVSQTYNLLSRIILSHKFSDMQCGFKAIRKDVFEKISSHLFGRQWFFDTEMIIFCKFFGFRVKEVPVDWEEGRWEKRKSKVNVIRDGLKFFADLTKLRRRLGKLKKDSASVCQKEEKNV
jgi:glycosyltransferase involved in cell wall biosynthesis